MAITIKDLCELAEINSEDEENDHIAVLLKDPIDRRTTGEACVKLLGYDPTVVFDQIEMSKILDEFIRDNNVSSLNDKREDIMISAMNYIDNHRYEYQLKALEMAIHDAFDDADDTISSVFEAWAEKHYSVKIAYDPDFDEDDIEDEDEDEEGETAKIGNDGEEYTSYDEDEDEDDAFDDDDDDDED